jgi:hypothetical protein
MQNVFQGFNGVFPHDNARGKGPKIIPYRVDLTNAQPVTADWQNTFGLPEAGGIIATFGPYGAYTEFDLLQEMTQSSTDFIQCVYVDNSYNPGVAMLQNATTRQSITIPPYSQGFVPLVAARDYKFRLTFVDRTGQFQARGFVDLVFLNTPMPSAVWNTRNEKTARWEDFSGTITVGGSFQLVGTTNAFSRGIMFQNPITATEPLNINAVAATTGSATAAQSIQLAPGQIYQDKAEPCIWRAWRVMGLTAGHAFACWQIVA